MVIFSTFEYGPVLILVGSRLRENAGVAIELALSEVAAGVFELPLPIPFEDGVVNVFVFPDRHEADLLDCGMNSDESVEALNRALAHLGAETGRPLRVEPIPP